MFAALLLPARHAGMLGSVHGLLGFDTTFCVLEDVGAQVGADCESTCG